MQMTSLDRVLLLATGLLAAYQVVVGIDGFSTLPMVAHTIAFGVLLVAGLLLIILGFDMLDSPIVVVASTIIPLALTLGLVWQHLPSLRSAYLVYVLLGFLVVFVVRIIPLPSPLPTVMLALVHGIAGGVIVLLPLLLVEQGTMKFAFMLVSTGGALIGVAGLLLLLLKTGKPILTQKTILRILPGLLFFTTACFVVGFRFG